MAVSGRRVDEYKNSVSLGSAEDFEHLCDPCLTEKQQVEAHGFCVDCQEYLCRSCFKFHQKTKALKNHQLLDKDSGNLATVVASTTRPEVVTEKCSIHVNEVIKFFCPKHEELGCTDCMTMKHRVCALDYIPNKCGDIGNSEEYRDVTEKMDQKFKVIEKVLKSAKDSDLEIESCHDDIEKEIAKFRKEINTRLDQLQQEILTDASEIKSKRKETIQELIETCTRVSTDIKTLMTNIKDSKTKNDTGRIYIDLKRAKSILKTDAIQNAEKALESVGDSFKFERNKNLENSIMLKENNFGQLCMSKVTQRPRNTCVKLTLKEEINIKTRTDASFFKCCVNGCAVLSSNMVVFVETSRNKKVKVVDIQNSTVVCENELDSEPYDVVALSEILIAITLPEKKEVLILAVADNMPIVGRRNVTGVCKGITHHQEQTYVLCKEPASVLILDLMKNLKKKTIPLNEKMFKEPMYIAVGKESNCMYISDRVTCSVKSITLEGEITAEYQFEPNSIPKGLTTLDDGSLLVCCMGKEIIFRLSADLKQCLGQTHDVYGAQSICYNRSNREIYVGGYSCNSMKVFALK